MGGRGCVMLESVHRVLSRHQLSKPHGKSAGTDRPSRQNVKVLLSLSDTDLGWVMGKGWVTLKDMHRVSSMHHPCSSLHNLDTQAPCA